MTLAPSASRERDEHDEVRDEVRAWLAANDWRALDRRAWLDRVVEARWAVPTWPLAWFGRDWDAERAQVVVDEFAKAGAPGAGQDRTNLWANTVVAFGDDDLKRRFLRRLLTDELSLCLLYSEPGAGSDLAAVQTTARRDGDEWTVNGQKVWTSGAQHADYGMLLARTDWDVPKHKGLSFFMFPMKQPGVVVRPIKQITGEQHFNEVFITDARVPDANRVGAVGAGWRVLQTALVYERSVMGSNDRAPRRGPWHKRTERDDPLWGTNTDLIRLARERHRTDDALVRQDLARTYTDRMVNHWTNRRAVAALERGGSSPLPSLGKLAMSRIVHDGARVHTRIVATDALLAGPEHPAGDAANFASLNAYFTSIGGGTDQVQRNIVGERILGLPKEPDVDRDIPFRAARRAHPGG